MSTHPIISSINTINLSGKNLPITSIFREWLVIFLEFQLFPDPFLVVKFLLIKTPVNIVPFPGSQIRLN